MSELSDAAIIIAALIIGACLTWVGTDIKKASRDVAGAIKDLAEVLRPGK